MQDITTTGMVTETDVTNLKEENYSHHKPPYKSGGFFCVLRKGSIICFEW